MISVIIPIFNAEKYLQNCLESILKQNYSDFEIILIDDESSDNSLIIAQKFADKDDRIRIIKQKHAGQAVARNLGIESARGDLIVFIDADDYIDSDFFDTIASRIADNDVLQIGYKRIDNQGIIIKKDYKKSFYIFTTPWSRIYKRDFIEKNHLRFPEGMIYEDVIFTIDMWLVQPKYRIIDYCGYYYRKNPNSTTAKKHSTKLLFDTIKSKTAPNIKLKIILLYTNLRLKLHFAFNR